MVIINDLPFRTISPDKSNQLENDSQKFSWKVAPSLIQDQAKFVLGANFFYLQLVPTRAVFFMHTCSGVARGGPRGPCPPPPIVGEYFFSN